MKIVRLMGSIVGLALLVSLIPIGSAAATVLCKNNTSTAACTESYPAATSIEAKLATGSTLNLTDTAGNPIDTCTASTMKASVTSAGGGSTPVSASISSLSFSSCTQVPTTTLKAGEFTIEHIPGSDNGTFKLNGTEVTIAVFGVSCVYGAKSATDLGTLTGGKNATLAISAVLNEIGTQFLCPDTAKFTGSYKFESPENLFVAAS